MFERRLSKKPPRASMMRQGALASLYAGIAAALLLSSGCAARLQKERALRAQYHGGFLEPGRPDDSNRLFVQFVRTAPDDTEKRLVDAEAKVRVTDGFGHTYTATKRGLRVCAPTTARKQPLSWRLRFTLPLLRALAVPLSALDRGYSQLFRGVRGCVLIDGRDGLPYERLTSIDTSDEDVILGSEQGVILWSRGHFHYFAGRRWLDDNFVLNAVLVGQNILVKTRRGYAKIEARQMTLHEKELHYDALARQHVRHGFVARRVDGLLMPSDNDGLWTAMYVAAQSFKSATANDTEARKRARESLDALLFLEEVTGVPGFFARAAIRDDEHLAGERRGKWHDSPNAAGWKWKGDTSVDELVGHFFAYAIYFDLVAKEDERERIRATVNRIVDRLIAHDLQLVDVDGWPTKYGGGPSRARTSITGHLGRGLLGLGTLAILKVAHHITGREDIERYYRAMITGEGFAFHLDHLKIQISHAVNHSDDQLAFLSFFNLVRLENDPDLRRLYLHALERFWRIEQPERNPLWNAIYGALSGSAFDRDGSLQTLRETPLDLRRWRMTNSHRDDVRVRCWRDRHGRLQSDVVLPFGERVVAKWNHNPYRLDDGSDTPVHEVEPAFWLLPYWMGRYYRLW